MSGLKNVRFVKASAGSGKTYSVTTSIAEEIKAKKYSADQVLATTFTVKAANDLESRIRAKLLEDDTLVGEAGKVRDALIGTVNSVCGRLLSEQAIAAGESPSMTVLPDESADLIFNQAISGVLAKHAERMNGLAERLFIRDWSRIVRLIIASARTNGLSSDGLAESKAHSLEQAKRIYIGGKSITASTYQDIVDRYRPILKGIVDLGRESALKDGHSAAVWDWCDSMLKSDFKTWKDVKSCKLPKWPAPRSRVALEKAAPVEPLYRELADNYVLLSNELQKEVTEFIESIFSIATEAMEKYAWYKKEYGLVDFVDQEVKVLELLDKSDEFREGLRTRVKAMYVDEFQDTNPVQLAVYLKLAEVIDGKTTWVGDPKQAIYRFRGADLAFMSKVMNAIDPGNTETLPYSWRSRQNLVDFASEVFAQVFPDLEAKGEVRLDVAPEEKSKEKRQGGKIGVWQIESRNAADYAAGLANQIAARFRNSAWKHYGDVAVLLHDNSECALLAEELQKRGVPTSIGGTKLRDDLIANLAMCAYRYVFSTEDTIAKAVLAAYRPNVAPKTIVDPNELAAYSPLELLEKSIVDWRIDDYARGSDSPERGLATLEALRQLCRDYEGTCKVRGLSAKPDGFIKYFMETQTGGASASGCDCVQIYTYHGSKGLEWDTVILGSLGETADGNPFGVKTVQLRETDVEKPLANRAVRYVPTPFGDNRIQECSPFAGRGLAGYDEMSSAENTADTEEKRRLMYVGVTRAKSEMIFAPLLKLNYSRTVPPHLTSKTMQAGWLELLTSSVPLAAMMESTDGHWMIGGKTFDVAVENVPQSKIVCVDKRVGFTDKPVDCPAYPKAKVAPSSLEGMASSGKAGENCTLSAKLSLLDDAFSAELGECFHSYVAVAVPREDDLKLAQSLIARWKVGNAVSAEELVAAGRRLREWIAANLKFNAIRTEMPMRFAYPDGRISEGFIDMLVEKEDGSVVMIDHKVINDHSAETCVKTYAAQQQVYRSALMATGCHVDCVYLHLPVQGKMVEIKFA